MRWCAKCSDKRNESREACGLRSGSLAGAKASVAGGDGGRGSEAKSGAPGGTSSGVAGHHSLSAGWLHGAVDGER